MTYLFLDTETGGIGLDKSLLSAGFVIADDKGDKIESLNLNIKPDDGVFRVTGESLGINKINLQFHELNAITYKQAGQTLYKFLERCFEFNGLQKLIPVGHGIDFDTNQICDKLLSRGSWERFVTYRSLDTRVIASYLRIKNKIPSNVSCGLERLGEYFNVKPESGQMHEALYDAELTRLVFKNLMLI
jgi:DNA polymerase III alpha subunit (gram-positive type)